MNSAHRVARWILGADLLWAAASLAAAVVLRTPRHELRQDWMHWWPVLMVILLAWSLLFSGLGLDGFRSGWRTSTVVSQCLLGVATLMLVLAAGGYAGRILRSRLALSYFAVFFMAGIVGIRWLAARRLKRPRAGRALHPTLILGDGNLVRETLRRVERHPELGWSVIGVLTPESDSDIADTAGASDLRALGIMDLVSRAEVDQIVVATERPLSSSARRLLESLRTSGVRIIQVPAGFELYAHRPQLLDLDGIPVISYESMQAGLVAQLAKRLLDCFVALGLLVLLSPVWITLSLRGLLTAGKPWLKLQRAGRRGRPFAMYRFSSGGDDSPLRHLGISELPQLFNVLRGEMSLVGPRPEPPETWQAQSERLRTRLDLLPGITGLAQVHGWREGQRHRERYSLDLEYVARWDLWRDVAILLQTGSTLFQRIVGMFARTPGLAASSTGGLRSGKE